MTLAHVIAEADGGPTSSPVCLRCEGVVAFFVFIYISTMRYALILVVWGLWGCNPISSTSPGTVTPESHSVPVSSTDPFLPQEVQHRIEATIGERIDACLAQARQRAPVRGLLGVQFQVAPTGRVIEVKPRSGSEVTDEVLIKCILDSFREVTFPPYDQQRKVNTIIYMLDFGW